MRTFVEVDDEDGFLKLEAPEFNHFFHCPKEWLPLDASWDQRNAVLAERIDEAKRWCARHFNDESPRWRKLANYAVFGFINPDDAMLFKIRFC
jgi:hypothetical protein